MSDRDDLIAKEEKETSHQVNNTRYGGHHVFFFYGGAGSSYANGRVSSPAMAGGVARGGFGGIGAHASGGA
jgi:hypothetical protein